MTALNRNRLRVGDTVPDLTLPDQSGNPVRLSDFRGKNLVVYFYPKDDTPGCTAESCAFRDHYEAFEKAGAAVVGISADSAASHQAFANKYNLPFTLLADEEAAARKAFGVPKRLGVFDGRITYVIDKRGVVRHKFDSQLNVKKHVSSALDVLATLD